ncbi:hypothetical protein [Ruegeria atlantica]|uniref:hypothetical protein n=1 Tax=Ruegeria atlantica TaxID=81569 RepID=UPI001C2CAB7F|nr:hypothetical protein [Ruegeria atlantica]
MLTSTKHKLGALAIAPFMGVLMAGSAAAASEVCNAKTARDAANSGDYAALCSCSQVTPSFLKQLQKRSDFETTLVNTGAMCPGLAALLTDLPTESISASAPDGENRESEQFAGIDPDNGGGSGPGGGGGNPGDSGGNPGEGGNGGNNGGGNGGNNGGGNGGNNGGGNGGNNGGGNGGNNGGGNNGGPGNGNGNNGNPGNGGGNNGGSGPGTGNGGSNNGQGNGSGKGGQGNGGKR